MACADVAGPGFINLRLEKSYWHHSLAALLALGEEIERLDIGAGRSVNIEYVSANPTGPLHVGHCRGAVFGDALANLLECAGYKVTREYYVNDAGAQVDALARSAFRRYREALGESVDPVPENFYPGEYLVEVGASLVAEFGSSLVRKPESEWLPVVREFAISAMMKSVRADLLELGVKHDLFFSEMSLHLGAPSAIERTVRTLGEKDLIYRGALPPPKGHLPGDWEDREHILFRASDFGDETDRPIVKSDGSYTYFAADIAYFHNKLERGFERMIYVLGADHDGYVKRLEAVAAALSGEEGRVVVRLCRLVRLYRQGKPVKMSKRAGDFVTLQDVVGEVGPDALRFTMLFRSNDAPLDFDLTRALEQSRDNPVFYVQYAHARACSVLREAGKAFSMSDLSIESLQRSDLSFLSDEAELSLIKRLCAFRRTLENAALSYEPHRISFYLYELSGEFHALWNKGKESPRLRFIDLRNIAASRARLALIHAVALVLSRGLRILGVEAVQEMC